MQYRKLGTTGIEVSTVAMGCWPIAGDATWGAQDTGQIQPTIEAALDAGINFFDTAPAYGESELMVGKALADRRNDVVITTKVLGDLTAPAVVKACDVSLDRLGTDYIDLYQVHWPNHNVPIAETIGALDDLCVAGKIRSYGVSNFGPIDLPEATAIGNCQTNQLAYNLLMRAIEYEVAPACLARQVGVLCYCPLAQGLLTGKFHSADDVPDGRARTRHYDSAKRPEARHGGPGCEDDTFAAINQIRTICDEIGEPMADVALAWCLHQPFVTSVLPGARSCEQIAINARAADLHLDSELIERLNQATEPVKQFLGTNTDLWESDSQARMR